MGSPKSIRVQVFRLSAVAGMFFLGLCISVFFAMQRITLDNAREYTSVTAQKLYDQLEMNYDKLYSLCRSLSVEEYVRELLTTPMRQKTPYVNPMDEHVALQMILEPGISDIALVSDTVHYSLLYTEEELDEMREASHRSDQLFCWLGIRRTTLKVRRSTPAVLVYAYPVMQAGENIGTILISFSTAWYATDSDAELNSYYFLVDEADSIYIGARVEEGCLIITIKDSGVGIDEQMLREIKKALDAGNYDTSRHVGVINTQARIRLMYGERYGVQVESMGGDGTTVTLRVPAVIPDEGEE